MDCAHNQAGIRAFIEYLLRRNEGRIDLTFGVLDTKSWKEMIAMLAPHVNHWRLIKPDSDRALPLDLVSGQIQLSGSDVKISAYGGDYDALVRDLVRTGDGETRYVTGSMYMIGRRRNTLGVPLKPLWTPAS